MIKQNEHLISRTEWRPISLSPPEFDEAVSDPLKVRPEPKEQKKKVSRDKHRGPS